ncbi:hypothetical protein D3C80_1917700 [compost metagenome]
MGAEKRRKAKYEQVTGSGEKNVAQQREAQANHDPLPVATRLGRPQPHQQRNHWNGFDDKAQQWRLGGQCIYIEGSAEQRQAEEGNGTRHGRSLEIVCA